MLTTGLVLAAIIVFGSIFNDSEKALTTKAAFITTAIQFVVWLFTLGCCIAAMVAIN